MRGYPFIKAHYIAQKSHSDTENLQNVNFHRISSYIDSPKSLTSLSEYERFAQYVLDVSLL